MKTRLTTLLVDLLLGVILLFTTDKDDPLAVPTPVAQPQAGGHHG